MARASFQVRWYDSAAIEKILGFPMDDPTFAQASLTPRLGGLGLRKVMPTWLIMRAGMKPKETKETWTPPANLPAEYLTARCFL